MPRLSAGRALIGETVYLFPFLEMKSYSLAFAFAFAFPLGAPPPGGVPLLAARPGLVARRRRAFGGPAGFVLASVRAGGAALTGWRRGGSRGGPGGPKNAVFVMFFDHGRPGSRRVTAEGHRRVPRDPVERGGAVRRALGRARGRVCHPRGCPPVVQLPPARPAGPRTPSGAPRRAAQAPSCSPLASSPPGLLVSPPGALISPPETLSGGLEGPENRPFLCDTVCVESVRLARWCARFAAAKG